MKTLVESIHSVNEASEVKYRVAFLDFLDEEGLPPTVTILVPREYTRKFDKFLEDQEGNTFMHAEGGSVEY